ncbi:MAG: hypothetical protein ACK441_14315, partial [Burkholderiales bacterium]
GKPSEPIAAEPAAAPPRNFLRIAVLVMEYSSLIKHEKSRSQIDAYPNFASPFEHLPGRDPESMSKIRAKRAR